MRTREIVHRWWEYLVYDDFGVAYRLRTGNKRMAVDAARKADCIYWQHTLYEDGSEVEKECWVGLAVA